MNVRTTVSALEAGQELYLGYIKNFPVESGITSDNSDGWKGQNTISVYGEEAMAQKIAIHAGGAGDASMYRNNLYA